MEGVEMKKDRNYKKNKINFKEKLLELKEYFFNMFKRIKNNPKKEINRFFKLRIINYFVYM